MHVVLMNVMLHYLQQGFKPNCLDTVRLQHTQLVQLEAKTLWFSRLYHSLEWYTRVYTTRNYGITLFHDRLAVLVRPTRDYEERDQLVMLGRASVKWVIGRCFTPDTGCWEIGDESRSRNKTSFMSLDFARRTPKSCAYVNSERLVKNDLFEIQVDWREGWCS